MTTYYDLEQSCSKKKLFIKLFFLFFIVFSFGTYAQTVTGIVTSEDGPLPGATVIVKGTTVGTTTDFDGNFSIRASTNDILVVSFVGFASQEVAVAGQDQITVSLVTDNELEEVVITGYGSQRQKKVTSAVVKVEAQEFNQGAISAPEQLLQGKVAGLQIYNKGGDPNSEAGARMGKYSFKQFQRPDQDNDYIIVRLGELYLNRAEALARATGDWSLAGPDVNVIRSRAGVGPMSSITADSFLAERGREMFQETSRRTDLIRFGKYTGTWWEKPASGDHRKLFPIPFEQIQASNGSLKQNPGY